MIQILVCGDGWVDLGCLCEIECIYVDKNNSRIKEYVK